ncbi:MAG TPA: S46 family peptidase [Cyclobacteriaceae bacterium]|nr:S46 family peptidase [Cyclobacteriaceae bacterium]
MKKAFFLLLVFFSLCVRQVAVANEGMWLVHLLGEQVYNDMVKNGLKLSREQLYSLNKASLKDAIIIFGNGCTGEIVSPQGLIFTNHHCGYEAIADASTLEHNYLKNGFYAKSHAEEIKSEGLTVRFLVRIDDVTQQVESLVAGLTPIDRAAKLPGIYTEIAKGATEGTGYEGSVSALFKGNQFLLFVYERFRDIRLVGAPPESIGKFGGDTDNWEWPRHTGDFSVFRVYTGKDGKPADYSPDNVPLKPKYFLPVSIKGFKDGDYSMIFGYPGSTNRYETSYGVKLKTEVENNAIVNLRDVRLKLMMEQMEKDPAVRLKLASDYASIANYWKFFDGETKQLIKYDVLGQKKKDEEKFLVWAKGKKGYETIFTQYAKAYEDWAPYTKHRIYLTEGIGGSSLATFARSLAPLETALAKTSASREPQASNAAVAAALNKAIENRNAFMQYEDQPSDRNILAATAQMFYEDINPSQHPKDFYQKVGQQYGDLRSKATYEKMAGDIFSNTMFLNEAKWKAFTEKPDLATLQNDPAYAYAAAFVKNYNETIDPHYKIFTATNSDLGRQYLKGVKEMNPGKVMYPDATFTMRVSYGNVRSYHPRDAVFYDYVCTLSGVLEKYIPGNYEFDLPANLIEAAKNKNYGQYKDATANDLVVCFITSDDITGGNSGSPVLNSNGELIGLAFDGNYEALSHKIAFDKDLNRTICVDVRYVLWCIDVLGGAKNIISELTLK